jgi:hypothetical protein
VTTTVIFQFPQPNHLRARIVRQNKDQHGEWHSVPMPTILGPDNQCVIDYVHAGQRLIIEEIAGGEDRPLP